MLHNRFQPSCLFAAAFLAAVLPAGAMEAGKADGRVVYNGKAYSLAYAAAVEKRNEYNPSQREIVVFLSDSPVTFEEVEDEAIDHAQAHMELTLNAAGKPVMSKILHETSESGTGDGINFQGTVDRSRKLVQGKVFTRGKVDLMGSVIEYEVTFKAPIYDQPKPTASSVREKADAANSPEGRAYLAFDKAARGEKAGPLKKLASKSLAAKIGGDEYNDMTSLVASVLGDSPRILRVITRGDKSRLLLETDNRAGVARLVREDGEWKVDSFHWKFR